MLTEDQRRLLAALEGVDLIVVGMTAAILQGVATSTADIDILPHWAPANLERLTIVLHALDVTARLAVRRDQHFETRLGPLDVYSAIDGGRDYHALLEHTQIADGARVLSIPTVADIMRRSGRDKDRQRLSLMIAPPSDC